MGIHTTARAMKNLVKRQIIVTKNRAKRQVILVVMKNRVKRQVILVVTKNRAKRQVILVVVKIQQTRSSKKSTIITITYAAEQLRTE